MLLESAIITLYQQGYAGYAALAEYAAREAKFCTLPAGYAIKEGKNDTLPAGHVSLAEYAA